MKEEFETSLKSIETENTLDLFFYRPIGFRIACLLKNTNITPNMVTIFSIFVGAAAGCFFYYDALSYTIVGILLLISANILDCVDGQLARLTGIKSEIGRILDGMAGNVWFAFIYVMLALRLNAAFGVKWFFVPAILSGLSHLLQANITDYYKTVHLYFVSKKKGEEFQRLTEVKEQQRQIVHKGNRFLYRLYIFYTWLQETMTPSLQRLLDLLYEKYGADIPDDIRRIFREKSGHLMKRFIDFMTFNGRTVVLFFVLIEGDVWLYFVYETVVLNIVLWLSIYKHEKMCRLMIKRVEAEIKEESPYVVRDKKSRVDPLLRES